MSLIAHYKLDGDTNDSVGGNHLTDTTSSTNVVGKLGGALRKTSGSLVSNLTKFFGDTSISMWFKHNGSVWSSECLFGTRTGSNGFMFYRNSGDSSGYYRIYFWYVNTNGSVVGYYAWPGISGFSPDVWYHITMVRTYDGYLKFYRDGVLVYSANPPSDFKAWHNNGQKLAVHGQGNGSGYDTGDISFDDVRIYDHALSLKEVQELAKAKVLHYTFDEFQEPTENLLSSGLSGYSAFNTSNWNGATLTTNGTSDLNTPIMVYDTSGTSYTYTHDYILNDNLSDLSGKVVTFSVFIRRRDSAANGQIRIYDNVSGYSYFPVNVETYFKRFEITKTIGTNPTRIFVMIDNTGGGVYEFHSPQLEAKAYATPFVNGTRTGVVRDSSGQDNDAMLALATTPKWVSDSRLGGGAYEFVSNYINAGSSFHTTDDQTISIWVKPSNFSARRNFYNRAYGGEGTITQETNGTLNYFWGTNGGNSSPYQSFGSGTALTLAQWNHCVIVRKLGTGGYLKWFINGIETATTTPSYAASATSTADLLIGTGYTSYFNGSLDDVRIYATALTDEQVLELYQTRASLDDKGNFYA